MDTFQRPSFFIDPRDDERFDDLLRESANENYQFVDNLFVWLMVVQYLCAVVAAIWITPLTWVGGTSYLHLHVWIAVVFGGFLSGVPIFMARACPGSAATRHSMAVAQAIWSALLIHLTGGRIETHFHVFCSLAFIAFYRDWKVIATMTVVVTIDHLLRGVWWPLSVYGIATESPWRWIEHAIWVLLEDLVLVFYCIRGKREEFEKCRRQADLELLNAEFEHKVDERTREIEIEKKKAEQLALVAQYTSNAVIITDAAGKTEWINEGFIRSTGFELKDVLGKKPGEVLQGPDTSQDVVKKISQCLRQEASFSGELVNYTKANDPYWVYLQINPVRNQQGQLTRFIGVTTDVSDRKANEVERERLHNELQAAARIAGRAEVVTGVLHNVGNVLNSASVSATLLKEKLDQSNLGQLVRGIKLLDEHESDMADFLTKDEQGKHFPRFVRQVTQTLAAERESELEEVNSLLENIEHIRRIIQSQQASAGRKRVTEPIQLSEVIESAIKINGPMLANRDIRLTQSIEDLPEFESEQHEILQILINLIKNAAEACERNGSGEITVNAVHDSNFLQVQVSDNGIGIAADALESIFQHGFTTKQNGHGFGLHSSAIVASELGGSLSVQSDGIGHGATFVLSLPLNPSICTVAS